MHVRGRAVGIVQILENAQKRIVKYRRIFILVLIDVLKAADHVVNRHAVGFIGVLKPVNYNRFAFAAVGIGGFNGIAVAVEQDVCGVYAVILACDHAADAQKMPRLRLYGNGNGEPFGRFRAVRYGKENVAVNRFEKFDCHIRNPPICETNALFAFISL